MIYGIPYMGSKSKIASSIFMNFPKADNFYDLFGGGFSMSHYAFSRMQHKFKHVHYNEINSDIVELAKESIDGKYNYDIYKPEWISHDEFDKRKSSCALTRILWSFGNDQKSYLFSKEIEPYKKSMHNAVIFNEFNDISRAVIGDRWPDSVKSVYHKRCYIRQKIEWFRVKNKIPDILKKYLSVERLEQLERLQQLQQLERLERLHYYSDSYENIDIKPGSVVYCDIPYQGTADYLHSFDHKKFFDWAASREFPVFISEYNIEDDRFRLVYEVDKRSLLAGKQGNNIKSEKLYWNGV